MTICSSQRKSTRKRSPSMCSQALTCGRTRPSSSRSGRTRVSKSLRTSSALRPRSGRGPGPARASSDPAFASRCRWPGRRPLDPVVSESPRDRRSFAGLPNPPSRRGRRGCERSWCGQSHLRYRSPRSWDTDSAGNGFRRSSVPPRPGPLCRSAPAICPTPRGMRLRSHARSPLPLHRQVTPPEGGPFAWRIDARPRRPRGEPDGEKPPSRASTPPVARFPRL